MTRQTDFDVLLIEDNPGDVDLVREALKESPQSVRVRVARDGVEGLATLRECLCSRSGMRPPDLVLLDLNLPRMDGREVLREVRRDPLLAHIPVVVLTSSEAERDLLETYRLHANAVVTKPVDLDTFLETMRAIAKFWFGVARLPPEVTATAPMDSLQGETQT